MLAGVVTLRTSLLGAVFADAGYEAAKGVVRAAWQPQLDAIEATATDAKSVLQEWAQGRRLPLPRHPGVARERPHHPPLLTAGLPS